LRDNCRCSDCFHEISQQRLFDSGDVDVSIRPTSVSVDGDLLHVLWPDGHRGILNIAEIVAAHTPPPRATSRRTMWSADTWREQSLPRVDFASVHNESGLVQALQHLRRFGFVMVDNVPPTPKDTQDLALRLGVTRQTIFGDVWDFTCDWAASDTAYSTLAIGPHTDGTYYTDPPGFQMFHLLEGEFEGGESYLVDGLAVAQRIRDDDPVSFTELLRPITCRYVDDLRNIHHSSRTSPIQLDAWGQVARVAFNNTDRAPTATDVPFEQLPRHFRAVQLLLRLIQDESFHVRFKLTPGSPVIFDNTRVLHARRAFEGRRRICGAYWNHDEVQAVLRGLGRLSETEVW